MPKSAQKTQAATPATSADVAKLISTKTPLPADTPRGIRLEGIASVLKKASKAISPQTRNVTKTLSALEKIEMLSGLGGAVTEPWLALRALGLPSGSQIAISPDTLDNPVEMTLIEAAGYVPTTDEDDTVRGVFGKMENRQADTLAAAARIAALEKGQLVVSNGTGIIFALDLVDLAQTVASIDAKAPSRKMKTGDKISPVSYNAVATAELAEFTNTVFSTYRVRRIEIPNAQEHPTQLVESAALASVLPPVPSYKPHFHPEIISRGVLSDVQLEAVIYAGEAHSKYLPAHPDDEKKLPPRQGFLVGHGAGFGKSRVACGIIADNWVQGRRRHLWFAENTRVIDDARAEWVAFGGKPEDIIDIRELAHDKPIPPFSGIIFATYASLRMVTENGTRMQQLANWFGTGEDGAVIFDEAQNLRNAKSSDGKSSEISQQGQAALDLQDRLPNARVTYLSATSASDIASMGFAIRLGLWGPGTAFRTARRFFKEMEDGGTNALEMVARDLKAMGLYLAANLSFEGVKYERMQHKLTSKERAAQDRLSALWLEVYDGMRRAMTYTGASRLPQKTKGRFHRFGTIYFGMARARCFQALIASLNTPQMIESIQKDLANGHAAIVQLTNTFAANAERAIAQAEEDGRPLDDVEASAKDILLEYLRKQFPVMKVQAVRHGKKIWSEPVLDADGKPVIDDRAVAIRDQLIADVEKISIPEGPLEQILQAFGPDMVAEITGRSRRLVPGPSGARILEDRCDADVMDDLKAFMNDHKQILAFSQAGATSATYSAQKTVPNQRLRRHYVLQPGWRADLALQGMGRSHRSNQVQPPEYILLTTDLWANQRMISAVARGMRDLGALTRGLRQAASQEFFTQDDNLEDEFAETAWFDFIHKMASDQIPGMSIGQFEREAAISLRRPSGDLVRPLPTLKRFLNAMSAMSCDNQTLFGQHYRAELQALKIEAMENGTYDRGIETITPDSLIKLEDAVIYRDPRTGGETRLLKMLRIDELDPVSYDEARQKAMAKGNTRIAKSVLTGRIAILSFPQSWDRPPHADDKVEVIMPTGSRIRTREEVVQERWTQVDVIMAESLWNAELRERGDEEEREFWVISGTMLPIWDKLPRDRSTVYRMETDEGEQIIGRVVSESFVQKFLKRVDALTSGGLPQEDVDTTLIRGGVVTLANGWVLQGRNNPVTGTTSITLSMPLEDKAPYTQMIQSSGLKKVYGPLPTLAYLKLPAENTARGKALQHILGEAPAVGAVAL